MNKSSNKFWNNKNTQRQAIKNELGDLINQTNRAHNRSLNPKLDPLPVRGE